MTKFRFCRSRFLVLAHWVTVSCLAAGCLAQGQIYNQYNKEIRISNLPSLTARSTDASDVLAAAAEIIFRDQEVCCGKKSALGDRVRLADPMSLEAIANKLRGRNVLGDGRAFMVTAEYLSPPSVNVGQLITAVMEKPCATHAVEFSFVCGLRSHLRRDFRPDHRGEIGCSPQAVTAGPSIFRRASRGFLRSHNRLGEGARLVDPGGCS